MAIVFIKKGFFLLSGYLLLTINVLMAQNQAMPVFDKASLNNPLPEFKKSFIESAELSMDPTGFRIRGIKGWAWTPEQYLQEIPVLSKYKMNFLMNCFVSVYSHQKKFSGDTWNNEWWLPFSSQIQNGLETVISKCREYAISFCFSMHPQLNTQRPINLSDEKDFADFMQHYKWAQQKGVRWFSICLDDVYDNPSIKINGKEQAVFVNRVLNELRKKDEKAQMIFCPTWYWGTGETAEQKKYYEELAGHLDKDVYVFWTGSRTTSPVITLAEAKVFKNLIRHKVILWDNYPANDMKPTLHLQPVSQRDRDLYTVIEGYMSIPMAAQNQINRIPLFTAADYSFSPQNYNPGQSVLEAIVHQTDDCSQQNVLLDLVKKYSTDTITAKTGFNPVLDEFEKIITVPGNQKKAKAFIADMKNTFFTLTQKSPLCYKETKTTLQQNIQQLKARYKEVYKEDLP